jgi:hypothetical protein
MTFGWWAQSQPVQWPLYEPMSMVHEETEQATQVIPRIVERDGGREDLERRIRHLEKQYVQVIADSGSAARHADWSLLAMSVSLVCVVLNVAMLFSMFFLR